MTKPTIYLAGPVAALKDGGAGWRDEIISEWGDDITFANPLDQYNAPVEELTITSDPTPAAGEISVDELVEGDKRLLRESDGVLVGYTDVKSVGSPMEVMWARERDYPVALWVRDDTPFDELSAWYRHHATAITTDAQLAIWHLADHNEVVGDE